MYVCIYIYILIVIVVVRLLIVVIIVINSPGSQAKGPGSKPKFCPQNQGAVEPLSLYHFARWAGSDRQALSPAFPLPRSSLLWRRPLLQPSRCTSARR